MYMRVNKPSKYEIMHPDKLVDKYMRVFKNKKMEDLKKWIIKNYLSVEK